MNRLLLALALLLGLAAIPAQAQPGPTRFRPELAPPAPPPFMAAPLALEPAPGAAPAQTVLSCQPALEDPTVSVDAAISPWRAYRLDLHFTTGQNVLSPPQSLQLIENDDGVPPSGPDSDSVGQKIAIPANLAEIAGTLSYRYEPGSTGPGDLLRIELYEVGRLDQAGLIAKRDLDVATHDDGTWRSFEWDVADGPTVERLRTLGQADLLVTTVNADNGVIQKLWVDDISASVCVPTATLRGTVREGGEPAPDALILLTRSDAAGSRTVAATRSAPDGAYSFGGVPTLPAGASYRIWFLNRPEGLSRDKGRIGFWAGPVVRELADGVELSGLNFDIADVPLNSPPSYSTVVATNAAPARLSWGARGVTGERHQLCLYDPQLADGASGQPAQLCGPLRNPASDPLSFDLGPASFAGAPSLSFRYGRPYRWYVVVYRGDPEDPDVQYGYSFYERAVTFVPTEPPSIPPPTPEAGDPAGELGPAAWTLLVYVAADNAIDDPARAPTAARPAAQLRRAAALAAAYPTVNLVSLVDGYGEGGAQLCVYPPGRSPDCRLRAEPNSADPQELASFIAWGRERYTAAHTALLLIAPGQAAGELALDESADGGPTLSLQELQEAFSAAGLGGSEKLDLVIYQASNLGTIEALRATAPFAYYMAAPTDQVWQLGALERLMPLLAGPGLGGSAPVAMGVPAAYRDTASDYGRLAVSMAAYDLSRVEALAEGVEALALALSGALSSDAATARPALASVRAATFAYDTSGNGRQDRLATAGGSVAAEEDALLDLRDLAVRLRAAADVPESVQEVAEELVALLTDQARTPVIANVQRSGRGLAGAPLNLTGASGVGIFFPSGDRLGGQPALVESYLYGPAGIPRDSAWATMLEDYLAEVVGGGPGGATAGSEDGAQFRPLPGGFVRTDLRLPLVGK